MKVFILSVLVLCSTALSGIEPYYHSIKANKGDGIYSVLRRYHLIDHDCNKKQFLELNKLTLKDNLIIGKKYKLPIKIYEYNGKSIRTTVGIESWEQAVRIKEYNERIRREKLRSKNYLESKILWVPHHETECSIDKVDKQVEDVAAISKNPEGEKIKVVEEEPTSGQIKLMPIFGEKHKTVKIKSDKLKNEVYYIVSGHGGIDPGAMCTDCPNTLCEDEYAYDVALRLSRELISHGATTHIVVQDADDGIRSGKYLKCDKDETIKGKRIKGSQLFRLRNRAGAINHQYLAHKKKGVKKQVAIMIHVDSNTKNKRMDAYFFHHKTSKSSKKMAQALQSKFKEKYEYYQKDRGYKGSVKPCNLFMINNTYPTSVLIELANIKNKTDQKRLIKESNRELLAQWIYEGIISAKI